jgi:hypothetical protein
MKNNKKVETIVEIVYITSSLMLMLLYKKTLCQFQIKFITDDYLQMCKTLQLFTNSFTFNAIYFTSIKVIKNPYVQTQSY